MRWFGLCAMAAMLALGAGPAAAATAQGTNAILKWKVMDNCAKQAQKEFPDFSAESNAKREASLKNCLNANNLPPREPASPASR